MNELLNKFNKNNPDKQIILLFEAGSHFFDLNGPDSDKDYRGLYLDLYQDSFESNKSKIYQVEYKTNVGSGKNSSQDIDFNLFSLTGFFNLLGRGDFNCMEMLYAPESKIIYKTPLYDELISIRRNLLVNDISAFLGFIKKEIKRYGTNIFHYKLQEDFLNFLSNFPSHNRLKDHWDDIKSYGANVKGIRFVETKISNSGNTKYIPTINIAERDHQYTSSIKYVSESIQTILEKYGHRQRNMASSGVEFKGLYHALRLIYEANDLLDYGEFIFPFNSERYQILKNIKNGLVSQDYIFSLIDSEVEKLYEREKLVISNKERVREIINRLDFTLRGRFSILSKIT
jgi:hypothetical protein